MALAFDTPGRCENTRFGSESTPDTLLARCYVRCGVWGCGGIGGVGSVKPRIPPMAALTSLDHTLWNEGMRSLVGVRPFFRPRWRSAHMAINAVLELLLEKCVVGAAVGVWCRVSRWMAGRYVCEGPRAAGWVLAHRGRFVVPPEPGEARNEGRLRAGERTHVDVSATK